MKEKREVESVNVESELSVKAKEPGFWREVWQQARLVFYLLSDPEVPFYLKVLPLLAVAYVLFPVDLLPDLAPVIGQLDDLTFLLVGSKVFVELAPPQVVARHLQAIRSRDGFGEQDSTETTADDVSDAIIIDGEHEVIPGKKNKP